MEPTPSQVRNHYSQKKQEAHLDRALAFKKAANLHIPSNVCLQIICLRASYCDRPISLNSSIKQDDDTDQDIGDDESEGNIEDTGESTFWFRIEEDDLDHQQNVLLLGQAHQDMS